MPFPLSSPQVLRPSFPRALIAAVVLFGIGQLVGVQLSGGMATALACLALLIFGLPHGTLDLEIIRKRLMGPWTGMVTLALMYLGLAAGMYGLWRVEPVLALAAFIAIAVVHFHNLFTDGRLAYINKNQPQSDN